MPADQADRQLGSMAADAVIRARAPLRISFGGGGTDLMPYSADHGGLVLNATVNRYAYATVRLLPGEPELRVRSLDYNTVTRYSLEEPLIYDGKLDLVKACLRRLRVTESAERTGLELFLQTDAPPGSGLGASSALVVAVIGAMAAWQGLTLSKYEIAHLAYELERTDVGVPGGAQDQYSATFGGFNVMEFRGPSDVVVTPLRLEPSVVHELEYNSLLVFTGATRLSSHIIEDQVGGYRDNVPSVVSALDHMKELAADAKTALLRGHIMELGEILDRQWTHKKTTSRSISNASIDQLYEAARERGAVGGKMSGAGGGGFMYLVCPFDRIPDVSAALTDLGATTGTVEFVPTGMESWVVDRTSHRAGSVRA